MPTFQPATSQGSNVPTCHLPTCQPAYLPIFARSNVSTGQRATFQCLSRWYSFFFVPPRIDSPRFSPGFAIRSITPSCLPASAPIYQSPDHMNCRSHELNALVFKGCFLPQYHDYVLGAIFLKTIPAHLSCLPLCPVYPNFLCERYYLPWSHLFFLLNILFVVGSIRDDINLNCPISKCLGAPH